MRSNANNVGYPGEVWKIKLSKMSTEEVVSVILGYEEDKQTDVYKQTMEELRGRSQEEIDKEERRITKQWDQASREIERVRGEIKQKNLKRERSELCKELVEHWKKWKEMYARLKILKIEINKPNSG